VALPTRLPTRLDVRRRQVAGTRPATTVGSRTARSTTAGRQVDLVAQLMPSVLLPFHALHLIQVTVILWSSQMRPRSTAHLVGYIIGYGALFGWFAVTSFSSITTKMLSRQFSRLAPVTTAVFMVAVFPALTVEAWRVHGLWLGIACADCVACLAALESRKRIVGAVAAALVAVLAVSVGSIDGWSTLGTITFFLIASNIGGVAFVAFGLAQIVRRSAEDRAAIEAELAVARERNRLHRIIHDSALQPLEALGGGWDVDIEHVRSEARHQAGLLRAAIRGESGLDALVFSDRLRSLAAQWKSKGLDVHLHMRADDALLQPGAADALAGATNEALSNVAKHAHVSTVDVESYVRNDRFHVVVRDTGTGFDTAAALKSKRLGLSLSIHACMAEVGGGAQVESSIGAGSTVTLWVPC
jgi:signal transduction histidine kinase